MIPIRIPVPAGAASGRLYGRPGRIAFLAFRETTGGAGAVFDLVDGGDNTGDPRIPFSLLAGESVRDWTGHHGIPFFGGLYLNVISGSIIGYLQIVEEEWWESMALPVRLVDVAAPGS